MIGVRVRASNSHGLFAQAVIKWSIHKRSTGRGSHSPSFLREMAFDRRVGFIFDGGSELLRAGIFPTGFKILKLLVPCSPVTVLMGCDERKMSMHLSDVMIVIVDKDELLYFKGVMT